MSKFSLVCGLTLALTTAGWASDTPAPVALTNAKAVAVGDWSEPVNGLRGRLVVGEGRVLGNSTVRETVIYLELQNAFDAAGDPLRISFDPGQLKGELRNAKGEPVPRTPGRGSGGRPGACWLTLPYDSALRLRVNAFGFGRPKETGFLIPLTAGDAWLIPAGDANDYFFSGTFASDPPKDTEGTRPWAGTLTLPKAKISLKGR
jgi:hypothetical protein